MPQYLDKGDVAQLVMCLFLLEIDNDSKPSCNQACTLKKTYVKLFVVDICPVTQVIWKCRQIFVTFLPSSKAWTFRLNTYKSNNFPSSYWPSKSVFDNWVLNTRYTPAFVHGYPKYKTRKNYLLLNSFESFASEIVATQKYWRWTTEQ